MIKNWLSAARLRTLPLALSCTLVGSGCGLYMYQSFNIYIFILAIITTILLQILSNFANDYGDAQKGTDNEDRIGPQRAIQAGLISASAMKIGIFITIILCLISGILLIYVSGIPMVEFLLFFGLGLLCILAAIKYTMGKNAYGYLGLGDVFVYIFFGIVGVCGTFFLQIQQFSGVAFLMAHTVGALSVCVLHLNNMRDIENDAQCGKNTLAVKLGLANSKKYFAVLLISALISLFSFLIINNIKWYFLLIFVLVSLLFIKFLVEILKINENKLFDPYLKKIALSTFVLSLVFFVIALSL